VKCCILVDVGGSLLLVVVVVCYCVGIVCFVGLGWLCL